MRRMEKEILRLLAEGARSAEQLAASLDTSVGDATENLQELREPGLVERSTITPGRWHITDAGRARLEQLEAEQT
jgi:predicted ArsR family transcriptional regulator